MIQSIFVAAAICLDSFALGITYGMKKIKISKTAIFIITLVTTLVLGISVLFGHIIKQFFSPFTASLLSSIVLIGLGCFFMLEGYIKHLTAVKENEGDNNLLKVKIPKLGIIIDIALDVTKADMDVSGDIDIKEALYLGIMLSIDSLGAGFGYAMGDMNILSLLVFVFLFNIVCISYGLYIGSRTGDIKTNLKTSLLPGLILIVIGMLKWLW